MPIYEYRCAACNRRSSIFVRSMSTPVHAKCEHCGSRRMTRLMSKFAVHRGSGDDLDDLAGLDDLDENDPQAVARWARKMRDETGEDMGPEFDEMIGRMEAGESAEDVMGGIDDGEDFGDDGL